MKRIFIKTCLLSASLLISAISFSQQGGQMNSGNQANPAAPGTLNQPGQNIQTTPDLNNGLQNNQTNQNDQFSPTLQPGESYPVDQNLQYNQNAINSLNQLSPDVQNNQLNPGVQNNQVTPGVQNPGNPSQTLPSGQGSQSVPGNTGNGQSNQINPGINNNPGVPNDPGTQNPANIQNPPQNGQNP